MFAILRTSSGKYATPPKIHVPKPNSGAARAIVCVIEPISKMNQPGAYLYPTTIIRAGAPYLLALSSSHFCILSFPPQAPEGQETA